MINVNVEEFLEIYKNLISSKVVKDYQNYDKYSAMNDFISRKSMIKNTNSKTNAIEKFLEHPYIVSIYQTGGVIGANAFDNSNAEEYKIDEFQETPFLLDDLIERTYPDITFSQYREIIRNLDIETQNHTNSEYYGNDTHYVIKFVSLMHVYNTITNILSDHNINNNTDNVTKKLAF